MGERRTYSEEFKKEAIELSFNSDKPCTDIAEELGISYHNLIRWRREYNNKVTLLFLAKENKN